HALSVVARLVLFTACASLPLTSLAAGNITIAKQAPYAQQLSVPDAVRAECNLPTRVTEFVKEYADKSFDKVVLADNVSAKTPGQALSMKIVGLTGTGGGAWSGAKHVTVEGTLWENGKIKGTFTAMRYSGGGAFGGYKGTCAILGRCVKEIGSDVSKWLVSPSMNARLGDAK
ncbi:MAG: hypothetical protein AAB312_04505, partial [Pseudomonadota bacterium]